MFQPRNIDFIPYVLIILFEQSKKPEYFSLEAIILRRTVSAG